jgi:signal transduction histidine kinase
MGLSLVPLTVILLINITIIGWVMRNRDRTRSGFFLLLNSLALIIWVGGHGLFRLVGTASPWVLSMPFMASLLIPGNFLYYALTRPQPLHRFWKSYWAIILVFGPALLLAILEDYSTQTKQIFNYSYRTDQFEFDTLIHRVVLVYIAIQLIVTVVVLSIRYSSLEGPEKNTAKHMVATITGPIFFAGFFWASSSRGDIAIIPAPPFIFAIMAQVGIIIVLRQEELKNPKPLSRFLYYLTVVLVAFLLVYLFEEFYSFVEGSIVLNRTMGWIMLGCTVVLLMLARFTRGSRKFDDILFARAAEYRRTIEETRTELKTARERLHRAERLSVIGEISARVAHEIKNPLGPIRGYTQMMREKIQQTEDFKDRERFLEYLGIIQEEVDNIDKRIRDFLDHARQPKLLLKKTDLNQLIEQCARVLRIELATEKEVLGSFLPLEVRTDLAETPEVEVDCSRIEEAIFNLARNAVDALGDKTRGYILIKTQEETKSESEKGVRVLVCDNGTGFSSDNLEKFFEPFFTQKGKGTGLGLAIVKSTIEAHGGSVQIKNRPTGGGEVSFWLPYIAKANPGALLPKVL